jgi:hypothetical protein
MLDKGETNLTLVHKLEAGQEEKAGYHEVVFKNPALGSGVYFYRLVAGNFVDTKKMLLLK